jgi:hypothetical protein
MWLTGRLMPDFKTIANFRKDNGPAIRGVCRQFIVLCRQLNLFSQALFAVDGSRFKAVNKRDRNFTSAKVQNCLEHIEASIINRYLSALDTADQEEAATSQSKSTMLKEKIAALKKRLEQLKEIEVLVQATPDEQISLADPDARSMATSGKGTGVVGYNVQTAVDAQHHLIVAHAVTNVGHDRGQLAAIAQQAQSAIGALGSAVPCSHRTRPTDRDRGRFSRIAGKPVDGLRPRTAGVKHWLWCAVDQGGVVLDVLVQSRRRTASRSVHTGFILPASGRASRAPRVHWRQGDHARQLL